MKDEEKQIEEITQMITTSRKEGEIKLFQIDGDCLEAVGVPPRGCRAVINRTIAPVVGDLVWCRRVDKSITSYIKRVKSYEDGRLVVGTAYTDARKDFDFFAPYVMGVVEYVFDGDGDLAYRRKQEAGYRKQIEWISVDEKLPKHLEKVLVCDDKQNMFTALYVAYDNGGFDWCTSVRLVYKVTHWMPLPEAPKGGAE